MDMKKHLPSADLEKLGKILEIKEAYQRGDISLEEGRTRIREQIGEIRPYEIALAEQELKTIEENECRKEDIQKMIELFDEVMDTNRPNLPLNHPIMCYYRENDEMRRHMLAIEDLVQYPIIKNQWLELYDQIAAFRTHLSRKQNQLYSILEQKGFDRPTTTMWLLDDFVRDEIRDAKNLLRKTKKRNFGDAVYHCGRCAGSFTERRICTLPNCFGNDYSRRIRTDAFGRLRNWLCMD